MSSPTSNHNPVITPDLDVEQLKLQDVLRKESAAENVANSEAFRSLSSPYNQQIGSDTTSPPPFAEIPQWKKDLIQRRKTNIAKTIAANQNLPINANTSKATTTPSFGAISPNSDVKNFPIVAYNNKCDKSMISASNLNTTHDVKSTPSQHSSASALNLNNMGKMPATLPHHHHHHQQQQQVEIESCGGHYTQVNNKSSGGSHKYIEKLASPAAVRTSASILQPEQQAPVPVSRSFAIVEQNSNDGGSPSLAQENVKFRKNPTEHHETTNTTSSDSLLTSTSRLSSSLKVAAAAEIYKKSNKEHLSVCVGETTPQQAHTLQEPALTTNVKSNSNNNGNSGGTGTASDDEQLLHRRQLKSEQESDSLSSSCAAASVNVTSPKEVDFKVFPINNSVNGSLSPKVLNKKPCGIASASVRSSPTAAPAAITTSSSSAQSQFVKNPTNSNLVSSHHNYKINSKYRSSQNTPSASVGSGVESPTTVTNNKKKMVAVQEMNEITNNELDFDPSEELQYGPGIVSKLRCRYLSLALRQSGKQRLSMDTMRRATSLNNLLDDNDVHDEDDDEDDTMENTNKESNSPTMVSTTQENATKSNEPIAGGFKKNAKNHSGDKIPGTTLASYNNHQHRSRHIKRGNDSLKRARSVEALLCEKSPWNFCNSQPTMLGNCATDSVTIEDKINNARDRLLSGTDSTPKRLTSIIDDTERPPPDLVKQTLKIFEASANRRGRVNSRSSGGEVASKVANYRTIITQNKPAVTFPKPPVSPKKSNLKKTTTTTTSAEVKKAPASTPPTTPTSSSSLLLQAEKNLVGLSSTPAASSRTTAAFRQKMDFTPIRSIGCVEGLSENSPDIIPRHKLLDKTLPTNIAVDSPVTELTKKIEKLRIESPAPATQTQQPPRKELQSKFSAESSDRDSEDDDDDDSIDGEYVVNIDECTSSTKPISKSALENIAKAGTSQQFQFQSKTSTTAATVLSNGSSGGKYSEALHDIPTLTITGGGSTVKQIGVIRPLLVEPQYSENNSTIGSIEENTSSAQSTPSLTSREIEKNRINNEKKIEKLGSNNSMDELGCVGFAKVNKNIVSAASTSENDDAAAQAPAWSSAIINKKKRNPAAAVPENNTMVFNFKDRKEVPDYIENDGLIFKRKRELPKPNESGFVLLGDLSLETSTDPEDDWPMCPPSPCDVEFENANILIDGKSSIKNKPKDPHFRVQFNDTLTSTFEYPSESSVIEDSGSEYADHISNAIEVSSLPNPSHETDAPIVHHHVTVDEIIQLPHNNKVLGNLSLGSAPLGSYTPVKAKIENIFQLGVTRVPNSQSDKSDDEVQTKEKLPADYYGDLDDPSLEYLKPASDDLTIAYSEGSLKTDLLY